MLRAYRFPCLVWQEGNYRMTKSEESGSPSWGASFFMQTEDVAKAVAAAAAAATATAAQSPRPSVIFSSKDDNGGSQLQKLGRHVTRFLKGFSQPTEVKLGTYNPEVLTSQKRQWANFQVQYLVSYHKVGSFSSKPFNFYEKVSANLNFQFLI